MSSAADYTYFRGYRCCVCVAEWFPVYERMLALRGITSGVTNGRLRIFQFTGTAAASAGTHSQGGAMDTAMLDPRGIRLAREMGASASWIRWWPGNLHAHMVLDGCPHNGPARYQITAVKAGFDGTGYLGRGVRDAEWRPSQWRTWRTGLAWARAQLALHNLKEQGMELTDKQVDRIADAVAKAVWVYRWNNNDLNAGQRLERAYQNTEPITRGGKKYSLRQVVANIETALLPIRRDGKPVSVRQELADAKTAGLAVLAALVKPTPRMAAPLTLAPVPIADVDTDTPTETQEEEG